VRHDLHIAGHAFSLRPVGLYDAAFIVDLRRGGGPYINRGAQTPAEQRAWIERYFTQPGDYYFVIERNDDRSPQATAALYDVDAGGTRAEWGRFVVAPGAPAAVETALLVYRCAFERLALDAVYCRTLADNVQVVAFHDSCGLTRRERSVEVLHDGVRRPAVEHVLERARFAPVRAHLDRLAARVAARASPRPAAR